MRLQSLANLFWSHMAMVVKRIKAFVERLATGRTEIALVAIRHFAVLMRLYVSAEEAFHWMKDKDD
jgi:hypothetical protein